MTKLLDMKEVDREPLSKERAILCCEPALYRDGDGTCAEDNCSVHETRGSCSVGLACCACSRGRPLGTLVPRAPDGSP